MAGRVVQRSTTASISTKVSWRQGKDYNDAGFFNSAGVTVEFAEDTPSEVIETTMEDLYNDLKTKCEERAQEWRDEQEED